MVGDNSHPDNWLFTAGLPNRKSIRKNPVDGFDLNTCIAKILYRVELQSAKWFKQDAT